MPISLVNTDGRSTSRFPSPRGAGTTRKKRIWERAVPRTDNFIDPGDFPGLTSECATALKYRILEGLSNAEIAVKMYYNSNRPGTQVVGYHKVWKATKQGVAVIRANRNYDVTGLHEDLQKIVLTVWQMNPWLNYRPPRPGDHLPNPDKLIDSEGLCDLDAETVTIIKLRFVDRLSMIEVGSLLYPDGSVPSVLTRAHARFTHGLRTIRKAKNLKPQTFSDTLQEIISKVRKFTPRSLQGKRSLEIKTEALIESKGLCGLDNETATILVLRLVRQFSCEFIAKRLYRAGFSFGAERRIREKTKTGLIKVRSSKGLGLTWYSEELRLMVLLAQDQKESRLRLHGGFRHKNQVPTVSTVVAQVVKKQKCPRCQGKMIPEEDLYGKYETCMMCGYVKETNVITVAALEKEKEELSKKKRVRSLRHGKTYL